VISYTLHPEPTHIHAPNAWMVSRRDDVTETDEMIAHGISLSDALEEIKFDAEAR
jgi:hypothetical protein